MLENKVTEMLGQLADKLGVASAKIWEWSLLQVKVDIVTSVLVFMIALAVTTLSLVAFKKYARWKKEKIKEDKWFECFEIDMAVVVIFIVIFVLDIYSGMMLCELPKLLINPEYAAFENIVKQLGSLK